MYVTHSRASVSGTSSAITCIKKVAIINDTTFIDLPLKDEFGNEMRLRDLKGKIVFLDFWFTGCAGCIMFYDMVLKDIKERYHKQVAFVSVSIDEQDNRWKTSLASNKYTDSLAINLYTGGMGESHPIIDALEIKSYPALMILDSTGNIFNRNKKMELRSVDNNKITEILDLLIERSK